MRPRLRRAVRPWRVEDGWVVVEPITVAPHAFVGANAVLEPGSPSARTPGSASSRVLEQRQTMPPGDALGRLPGGAGDRARPDRSRSCSAPPTAASAGAGTRQHRGRRRPGARWSSLHPDAGAVGVLVWWALLRWVLLAGLFATVPAGPLFVVTTCAVVAPANASCCGTPRSACTRPAPALGIRKWVTDKLLEFEPDGSPTRSTPRSTPCRGCGSLGARVGRGAEVSTAAHLDPDLLTLGAGELRRRHGRRRRRHVRTRPDRLLATTGSGAGRSSAMPHSCRPARGSAPAP